VVTDSVSQQAKRSQPVGEKKKADLGSRPFVTQWFQLLEPPSILRGNDE
jgi:hypothetical protein